jgi:hypothetical protein
VVPVSYREKIRVGRSDINFFLNIFFMFFSIISVTTDAILAVARNHPERIGSHGQSRWKKIGSAEKNRVGREPEPQVFFFTPHRLAKHSVFHIEKKLNIFLTFRHFLKGYMSKILLVSKRFLVGSFVWIWWVEIFILNFSKYWVLLACACHMLYLANKELL